MIECGSIEYAQARLQSRHGRRATEAQWQQLESTRAFAALLDAARAGPLRPWVAGITAQAGAADIEAVLRRHWQAAVAEIAAWMPGAWRGALAWCALLPELPVLQHLARGGAPESWMQHDPRWRELCAAPHAERAAVLGRGSWRALAPAWPAPDTLARAWQAEWRRRLPQPLHGADDSLWLVTAALQRHGAAFADAPPGSGTQLRRALQARLSLLLRRATLEPAAAFIHLALSALELERLRGELLVRRLFANAKVA
jgi:hypothetical protein